MGGGREGGVDGRKIYAIRGRCLAVLNFHFEMTTLLIQLLYLQMGDAFILRLIHG
jgi:hypothetical protein